ncbi:MAG: hypothetical protein ACFFBD_26070 [Candidatus Hodarchaeota archaeon]
MPLSRLVELIKKIAFPPPDWNPYSLYIDEQLEVFQYEMPRGSIWMRGYLFTGMVLIIMSAILSLFLEDVLVLFTNVPSLIILSLFSGGLGYFIALHSFLSKKRKVEIMIWTYEPVPLDSSIFLKLNSQVINFPLESSTRYNIFKMKNYKDCIEYSSSIKTVLPVERPISMQINSTQISITLRFKDPRTGKRAPIPDELIILVKNLTILEK